VPRVGWTPYREYRLWRNRPDLRFRGAMHESIVSAVTRVAEHDGLRIAPFDLVTIEHVGYEGDQSAKFARDEPMLLAEIEQLPERAYLYDHLARIYEAQGDPKRAVAMWRQGIAVARARNSMRREDLLVYVNLITHLLATDLVDDEVGGLLDEALAAFPRTPTLELAAARHELATGHAAMAAERVGWLLSVDPDVLIDGNSYDRRVFGEWAWELLGRCRFALGDDAGAADAFAHAERAAPGTDAYRVRHRLAEARARRPPTSGSTS
jgi:tetratricopeptide (TPR) repeat protein